MPAELQTLEVSEYGTNQPIKLCDTDSCACDSGYMIATLSETNYCIEEFFLSSGNDNNFPNCQAMCCQTTCSKSYSSTPNIKGETTPVYNSLCMKKRYFMFSSPNSGCLYHSCLRR